MADTEAPRPTTNGNNGDGGGGDSDDEQVPRPVNIEQDVREMERRKRVDAIMSSKLFREELEKVVTDSIRSEGALAPGGPGLDGGLSNMISDAMSIRSRGGVCVAPINDIRGLEGMSYTKNEKALRCRLAAAYRLADFQGWTQGINNHISLRISQDVEHFLINPFGTLYSEVTASSLIKVDMQGNVVEAGTTNYGVNVAGFMSHSAIHANRPDLKCVLHLRHPPVTAVSSLKCGLMPLTQESCLVGKVSYHDSFGPEVDKAAVARDLGVHNKVMLLRNGGALCCGETVEEAFFYAKNLVLACEAQLKMMPLGVDNLVTIDDDAFAKTFNAGQRGHSDDSGDKSKQARHWGVGEMEFEASMRILDNSGYRTGHAYRHPLVKEEPAKPKSDVELPPAVSSLGYLLEEENLYKDGPLRALLSAYTKQQAKGVPRAKWVNSPNVYQKVEVLETGTPDPKTITKVEVIKIQDRSN